MPVLLATLVALQFKPKHVAVHAKAKAASISQGETPEFAAKRAAANNKFRKWFAPLQSLSVDITINQVGNPVPGKATLVFQRPGQLFYQLKWGKDQYTFTIDNSVATEVDLREKSYDVYDVPGWTPPEANGSDWVVSYFPSYFVDEQIRLPPDCFDGEGRVSHYAIASADEQGQHKNSLTFSNYKTNISIPESRFQQSVPAGLSIYGTPRPAPPIEIGRMLPNVALVNSKGAKTTLVQALSGKPTLVACLDPQCGPSIASLAVLKKLNKPGVIILNTGAKGSGIRTTLPVYHDTSGKLAREFRVPMTPLYYLVGPQGKVVNVWYGFDRDDPSRFRSQIEEAVQGAKS